MDVKVQKHVSYSPVTYRPVRYNATLPRQTSPRARYSMEVPSSVTPYRPVPINRGVIPTISNSESSIRKPENNTEQYLKEKAREQWAISKQTYRTLPLIEPKPKVRRDWPTGCYMKLMDGPSWHDPPKQLPPPKHLQDVINKYGQGVAANNPQVVHMQYNSPLNLYSDENVANALTPQSGSPIPTRAVPPPVVHFKSQLQKPLTVDITQSPTYQLLQEEEEYEPSKERNAGAGHPSSAGHSPSKFSPRGQHSPNYPIQTPYFRSLMNSLLPAPGY